MVIYSESSPGKPTPTVRKDSLPFAAALKYPVILYQLYIIQFKPSEMKLTTLPKPPANLTTNKPEKSTKLQTGHQLNPRKKTSRVLNLYDSFRPSSCLNATNMNGKIIASRQRNRNPRPKSQKPHPPTQVKSPRYRNYYMKQGIMKIMFSLFLKRVTASYKRQDLRNRPSKAMAHIKVHPRVDPQRLHGYLLYGIPMLMYISTGQGFLIRKTTPELRLVYWLAKTIP